jgi:hypothetical protein
MEQYFGRTDSVYMNLDKKQITEYRKYGDTVNQYVTNIRFKDYYIDSGDEITSYSGNLKWSVYHGNDCKDCNNFRIKFEKNEIVGVKIWPQGVYPPNHR